nr:G-type lectin S-receptor-like serine/threonine-protein kinase At4g27290 [Tanacetum cinerariifolium]
MTDGNPKKIVWQSFDYPTDTLLPGMNGNLVMTDGNPKKIVWQSFDYPTDTLLPGMKLGKNRLRGIEWRLSSWKTSQDPSPSDITWSVDTNGYPQYLLREGAAVRFRAGPWNGERFSGAS